MSKVKLLRVVHVEEAASMGTGFYALIYLGKTEQVSAIKAADKTNYGAAEIDFYCVLFCFDFVFHACLFSKA